MEADMVKRMVWVSKRGEEVAAATPQQLASLGRRRQRIATINGVECLLTAVDGPASD